MDRVSRSATVTAAALAVCGTAYAGIIQPPTEQAQSEQLARDFDRARILSEHTLTPSESGTREAGDPSEGTPADLAVKMKY